MKLIKKILNSVNSDGKYTDTYNNLQKSINKYHFREYFCEIGIQVFTAK